MTNGETTKETNRETNRERVTEKLLVLARSSVLPAGYSVRILAVVGMKRERSDRPTA